MADKGPVVNTNSSAIDQYVKSAQNAKGPAVVEVIKQALEDPGLYVFGELLDVQSVSELAKSDHSDYFDLLQLFAYGVYRQYLEKRNSLPVLTPTQMKKLKHLTIVSTAAKSKLLPYATLLQELDIANVRELEDLIIESIYCGIIHGKLDQKNRQLEVDYTIGRDVRLEDLGFVVDVLQEWCNSCEDMLSCVEQQICRANSTKQQSLQHKEAIQQQISEVRAAMKLPSQCSDEVMASDLHEADIDAGDKAGKFQRPKKQRRTPIYFKQ
ncbi:COP9 signalosome complex subunit 7b [Anabrus simplex]|uniref:COP9 signalosome complex subunit 7b n=1 Tax=Anabrus simplex TaxID=316456 RepID=UPI0034DD6862